MLQRLGEIVSDLYLAQGKQAAKLWDNARGALMRLACNDPRVAQILRERSVEGLAKLVSDLNAGVTQAAPDAVAQDAPASATGEQSTVPPSSASSAASAEISPEQVKSAMKAFRKRLKLTRLDDESRLARSPMSSGKTSQVAGILPPREFPQPVWDELVKQGKLRAMGRGFYELNE